MDGSLETRPAWGVSRRASAPSAPVVEIEDDSWPARWLAWCCGAARLSKGCALLEPKDPEMCSPGQHVHGFPAAGGREHHPTTRLGRGWQARVTCSSERACEGVPTGPPAQICSHVQYGDFASGASGVANGVWTASFGDGGGLKPLAAMAGGARARSRRRPPAAVHRLAGLADLREIRAPREQVATELARVTPGGESHPRPGRLPGVD